MDDLAADHIRGIEILRPYLCEQYLRGKNQLVRPRLAAPRVERRVPESSKGVCRTASIRRSFVLD